MLSPKDIRAYFIVKGYTAEAPKNPHPIIKNANANAPNMIPAIVLSITFSTLFLCLHNLILPVL